MKVDTLRMYDCTKVKLIHCGLGIAVGDQLLQLKGLIEEIQLTTSWWYLVDLLVLQLAVECSS